MNAIRPFALLFAICAVSCGSPPRDLLWQYQTERPFFAGDSEMYGPVLAGTQAIICAGYGWDRAGHVTSVDIATGVQRWSHEVGWCHRPPLITETEAIGWGHLETNTTLMKGVDLETGELLWQMEYSSQYQYAKPIVQYETIYLSTRDTLLAIDARSGEVVRHIIPECNQRESRAWLAYDSQRVLMGCNQHVYTLDGAKLVTLGVPVRWALDTVLRGDTLYLTETDALRAFDLATGRVIWQRAFRKVLSPPLVDRDAIYVHATTPWRLHRLDARTGDDVWTSEVRSFHAPLRTADALYTGDEGDLVQLNPATGEEVRRWASRHEISATPALSGDALLFGNLKGVLYAVRAR